MGSGEPLGEEPLRGLGAMLLTTTVFRNTMKVKLRPGPE